MASEDPPPSPLDYTRPDRRPHEVPSVPPGTGELGMRLFLIALFMLFAAAMLAYVYIRFRSENPPPVTKLKAVPAGSLHYPSLLWLSTILVIGVSFAMSRAMHFVRIERQRSFLIWVRIALAMAVGFLLVQAPAIAMLLAQHERFRAAGLFLYGMVFLLVLLHALHVLGGMIVLIRVNYRSSRGVYDHEHYLPVRHTAVYWHFLDVIWILMFATFLITA